MKQRILITGGAGQLGRALQQRMPADCPAGTDVRFMDSATLNITEPQQVQAVMEAFRPQLIINCAAYTAVDRAETDAGNAFRVNAEGVRTLAVACQQHDAGLLHISTDYVFGGDQQRPLSPADATAPLNVYGASKLAGEQVARDVLGGRLCIVRSAWLYSGEGHNFVRTMLRLMQAGTALRVVDDQYGCPTSALNLATVLWHLAERMQNGAVQPLYHFADGGSASWYEFAGEIQRVALSNGLLQQGVEITAVSTEEYPQAAQRPRYSVLDTGLLYQELGMVPQPWQQALQHVLHNMQVCSG